MTQKIKTTHRKTLAMLNTLHTMRDTQGALNVRYPYAVAKNIRYLEQHVSSIREIAKPDESYTAFDKDRVELNIKYAQKDARGRPRIVSNNYIIDPEKQADFDAALVLLKEKHSSVISLHEKKQKDIEAMLDDECEIDVYMIKLSWVPTTVKPGDMEVLMDIIEDDLPG